MSVSPLPIPASVSTDARSRALRTAVQGLLVDVSVAVVGAVADVRWTRAYWAALGLLVAKTAVQSAVSYVARRVVPPATS